MYLAIGSRPDISYAVGLLSTFGINPSAIHLATVKRLLRYIKGTMHLGLCYKSSSSQNINGFCNSDFARDSQDSKSTSGYVFTLAGASISWKSKKQSLVALSSTESEYIEYSEACREAIWLKQLYHEITGTVYHPPRLLCDNKSFQQLVKQPRFNERLKHIGIQYHHVPDSFQNGLIPLEYLQSADMTADILTKPLTRDLHQKHIKALGLQGLEPLC